jgi:hypothetical protein
VAGFMLLVLYASRYASLMVQPDTAARQK